MPEPVDPELYLRFLAERTLLDGEQRMPWGGAVERVGAALAAAGVLPEPASDAISEDYALAWEARGRGGPPRRARRPQPSPTAVAELQVSRIVPGPMEVPLSWGDLRVKWVRFGTDETSIAVDGQLTLSRGMRRTRRRRGAPWSGTHMGGPPGLQVADDQGPKGTANFNGGWGDDHVDGTFTVRPPLSADTEWIELEGRRITLSDRHTPRIDVAIETLTAQSPAVAYLWHELALSAEPFPGPPRDPDVTIDALIAVGAIEESDPQLQDIRRVAAAFSGQGGAVAGSGGQVPEPWASLLAQRSRAVEGATGTIPVAVITPPVNGVAVAVHVLDADPGGFSLEVETAPGWGLHHRFMGAGRSALAWWVEDDCAGVYLGHVGNSGGSADRMTGTVQFTGGLDPAGRELRILPTGMTERAVITIQDPWEASRAEPRGVR